MSRRHPKKALAERAVAAAGYDTVLGEVVRLLEDSRRASARAVNAVMTATHWEVGRRIVEGEQSGSRRARYGKELLKRLSADPTKRFRGFTMQPRANAPLPPRLADFADSVCGILTDGDTRGRW